MEHFDAIIIGFGKGGKLLAADLANRGQQVAIIERSAAMYGGSCINIACIPTKALIHQAQMIKELNLASFEEKAAAYRKAIIKKNEITTALRKLNFDRLNDHPNITVYTGVASFRSSRKIEVTTETDRLEIEGKRIFIDTGALPVIPPISGNRIGKHNGIFIPRRQNHCRSCTESNGKPRNRISFQYRNAIDPGYRRRDRSDLSGYDR